MSYQKCSASAPDEKQEAQHVLCTHVAEVLELQRELLHNLHEQESDERVGRTPELYDLIVSERASTFARHAVLLSWTKDLGGTVRGPIRSTFEQVAGYLSAMVRRKEEKTIAQMLGRDLEPMNRALPAYQPLYEAALKYEEKELAALAQREALQLQMALPAFEAALGDTLDREGLQGSVASGHEDARPPDVQGRELVLQSESNSPSKKDLAHAS